MTNEITARLIAVESKTGPKLVSTRTVLPGHGYAPSSLLEQHGRVPSMQAFGATKARPGLRQKEQA